MSNVYDNTMAALMLKRGEAEYKELETLKSRHGKSKHAECRGCKAALRSWELSLQRWERLGKQIDGVRK